MIAKKICSSPKAANGRNPGYGVEKNSYFDKNSRSLGGSVGFVSAIVITMVITCPIMGTLDVATDCLSIATRAYSKVNRYTVTFP